MKFPLRFLACLAVVAGSSFAWAAAPGQPCTVQGTAPARPAITGIAFVAFYEDDDAAARRFYHDELGLQPVAAADGATVYPVDGRQWIETRNGPADAARQSRQAAVGLLTPDVVAMERYLAAKGYVAAAGKCLPAIEGGRLTVHDPEGNAIVFVEAKPGRRITPGETSPRAISRRIIHAGFVVKNEAAENAFYRDVLGFTPYWRGGRDDTTADWVSQQVPNGTDWIEFMLNTRPDATAASRGVSNHVSLGVESMPAAIAQLKANGCDTQECTASKVGRDGKVQLNLYDPHHSRVEVMEFVPSGPVCCSPITGRNPAAGDAL